MTIDSPCIALCTLDPLTRICTGCGRSIDEITRWQAMSDKEQLAVKQRAQKRLEQAR